EICHARHVARRRLAAGRQFGNTTLLPEDRRKLQTLTSVEVLWLDLRYSLCTLWKSRGFATVSITTFALGIGAATAIFSVIDNVLLTPFSIGSKDQWSIYLASPQP